MNKRLVEEGIKAFNIESSWNFHRSKANEKSADFNLDTGEKTGRVLDINIQDEQENHSIEGRKCSSRSSVLKRYDNLKLYLKYRITYE